MSRLGTGFPPLLTALIICLTLLVNFGVSASVDTPVVVLFKLNKHLKLGQIDQLPNQSVCVLPSVEHPVVPRSGGLVMVITSFVD